MPADQTPSLSEAQTLPVVISPAPTPGEEPTLPMASPAPPPPPVQAPSVSPPVQAPPAAAPAPVKAVPPPAAAPAPVKAVPPPAAAPAPVKAVPPPAAAPEKPATWTARVIVPGAAGPGKRKATTPPAPTQRMARYTEPVATVIAPRAQPMPAPAPRVRRRRSGVSRFFTALFALVLLLAVPVVTAYVAYKLASGENPFEWPPTMDLSTVF